MKDLRVYREEFPITKHYTYLDHAGVAPVSNRVRTAVKNYLKELAEGAMFHGKHWAERISSARRKCAELIGSDEDEVAFVKNTSHGLSIVANGLKWQKDDNLLIYEKEFPSNIYPWLNLQSKGVDVRIIPDCNGTIDLQDIENRIDSRTRLISISAVQFMNGFRINMEQLGELCRDRGVLLCVDAIQSLGVFPMDVKKYNVAFLAADGHKWLLGPEGTGIFYCRRDCAEAISPPLVGWKSVQRDMEFEEPHYVLKDNALRFEEGSLNVMGIYALDAAVALLAEAGRENIEQRVLDLGEYIIKGAQDRDFEIRTPLKKDERGGIVSIAGEFNAHSIKSALEERGIMVNVRGGALRISPHFYNTESDVNDFFSSLDSLMYSHKR